MHLFLLIDVQMCMDDVCVCESEDGTGMGVPSAWAIERLWVDEFVGRHWA